MGKRSRKKGDEEEEVEDASEELPRDPTAEVVDDAPEAPEKPEANEETEEPHGDHDGRRQRVMRFAKRLMDRREISADTREILGSVLATSDKAKNEAVRMVAREVRSYLDALELKDDFKELITSYSLEISLSLKPLEHAVAAAEAAAAEEAEAEED